MKRPIRFVLAGLLLSALLVSLGLNYYLFSRGADYYRQLNGTRLDPLGLTYYPTNYPSYALAGLPLVVFYGDSRAADWPAPPGLAGLEFINRGIGSQTTAQVIERFDAHLRSLQPQVIILQVGINDLKTIPLFPERKEAIIFACEDNIRRIVQRANGLGATVILTTVFPIGEVPLERRPFWSGDVETGIRRVNEYIHTLASSRVIILDTHDILTGDDGRIRPEYSADLLHITPAGYIALNEALVRILADQIVEA